MRKFDVIVFFHTDEKICDVFGAHISPGLNTPLFISVTNLFLFLEENLDSVHNGERASTGLSEKNMNRHTEIFPHAFR